MPFISALLISTFHWYLNWIEWSILKIIQRFTIRITDCYCILSYKWTLKRITNGSSLQVLDLGMTSGEKEGDGELLGETDEVVYECGARHHHPILFPQPIWLQANRWYLAWARVSGPSSDCGSGGQNTVTTEDQLLFIHWYIESLISLFSYLTARFHIYSFIIHEFTSSRGRWLGVWLG